MSIFRELDPASQAGLVAVVILTALCLAEIAHRVLVAAQHTDEDEE